MVSFKHSCSSSSSPFSIVEPSSLETLTRWTSRLIFEINSPIVDIREGLYLLHREIGESVRRRTRRKFRSSFGHRRCFSLMSLIVDVLRRMKSVNVDFDEKFRGKKDEDEILLSSIDIASDSLSFCFCRKKEREEMSSSSVSNDGVKRILLA